MEKSIFRKKAMERISSPEQLSDYLRVTNPGVWIILSSIILILAGFLVWTAVGTLETTVEANAVVSDGVAEIVLVSTGAADLKSGMKVRIASSEYIISDVQSDEHGRTEAKASVSLPDGSYEAGVVTEEVHPIEFLLESR